MASAFVLVLALAGVAAGCGGGGSDGVRSDAATSADDSDPSALSNDEAEQANEDLLYKMGNLGRNSEDIEEGTDRLLNGEIKRAEKRLDLMEDVESSGRAQIELARVEAPKWSSEDDPLCEDTVPFPDPRIGYMLVPPVDPPYDWRREEGSEPEGVRQSEVDATRRMTEKTSAKVEEIPDDPGADEAKTLIAWAEKDIEAAEKALARGAELQAQITAQEERNEDLYAAWQREYEEELYTDIFC